MANAKIQTVETEASVAVFLKKVDNEQKQKDCFAIVDIMKEKSGFEPKMWGPAIDFYDVTKIKSSCFSNIFFAFIHNCHNPC